MSLRQFWHLLLHPRALLRAVARRTVGAVFIRRCMVKLLAPFPGPRAKLRRLYWSFFSAQSVPVRAGAAMPESEAAMSPSAREILAELRSALHKNST